MVDATPDFLNFIVPVYESWCLRYDSKTKQKSMEWHYPETLSRKKKQHFFNSNHTSRVLDPLMTSGSAFQPTDNGWNRPLSPYTGNDPKPPPDDRFISISLDGCFVSRHPTC
ncbi:hypothetical protein TNCV_2485401 [Trichonephila clavipes]|uniref:Uncharacterized protein n=1 Tax=Trichonephila clavipes TaxID=2585209 RepID=A0A8X6VZP5_TRICX|nr:hypothetical protein TNCV_2485401 [Trichonephila clavipes]